jgi:hypothetical protein
VTARVRRPPALLGWREWVALPRWGVPAIKAKVDTGARTSALHAFDVESFERDGEPWVRFAVHPWQRSGADEVVVEARQIDVRRVTSSSGAADVRPVVLAPVAIAELELPIEVTLTRRDEMGFRMLLGRQALRGRFAVDPARSYVTGRPDPEIRRRNRGRA